MHCPLRSRPFVYHPLFFISRLAGHETKSNLSGSCWRDFAITYPRMLSSFSSREAFLSFLFNKKSSSALVNGSFCDAKATYSYLVEPGEQSFLMKSGPFRSLLAELGSTKKVYHFTSPSLRLCFVLATLSFPPSFVFFSH